MRTEKCANSGVNTSERKAASVTTVPADLSLTNEPPVALGD